jgi:hypothetical protein
MFAKLAIPASLATVLMLPVSANAQFYGPGRWCAVVDKGTGNATWDCSYASIEQCRPNVIGGSLAGIVSNRDLLKWHLETVRDHIRNLEDSLTELEFMRL